MTWHVEPEVWKAYARGSLDPAHESSVEAHVVGCADCRAAAATFVDASVLQEAWAGVQAEVQHPQVPWPLRTARRWGLPADDVVLLSPADTIALPWITAVGAALACALVAGLTAVHQDALFLLLAPLVPVLAVVASYDATDPLREVTAATPHSALRLALLRTSAAVTVAVPVTLAIGLLVPGLSALAWVWLLPSLCLTVLSLVLLTRLTAWAAGAVVAAGWTTAVVGALGTGRLEAVSSPAVQLASAAGAAGLALVLTRLLGVARTGVPS